MAENIIARTEFERLMSQQNYDKIYDALGHPPATACFVGKDENGYDKMFFDLEYFEITESYIQRSNE